MDATRLIVRLGQKNRMVTKDYQRGVYDWGRGLLQNVTCPVRYSPPTIEAHELECCQFPR
jgi:hypothetical protein